MILEQYCQKSQRSKTEVLRELIRNLDRQWEEASEQLPDAGETKPTPEILKNHQWEEASEQLPDAGETKPAPGVLNHHLLSISARNTLWGKVKQVVLGDINAEVIVEIAPFVEIVAVITKSSVQRFAVSPQKEVCVVIKSSDVMIAVEM
ncbi:TOBE domain protein [Microseira wollei NIES-4236]|uniref:TOBE domain protein n=2 Tax=Microseira wollei TaxID=467598 RepID=A0AAV3X4Q8_9CYAN|nr:TOBE domain protein [Microseira wollei NIES-4236]